MPSHSAAHLGLSKLAAVVAAGGPCELRLQHPCSCQAVHTLRAVWHLCPRRLLLSCCQRGLQRAQGTGQAAAAAAAAPGGGGGKQGAQRPGPRRTAGRRHASQRAHAAGPQGQAAHGCQGNSHSACGLYMLSPASSRAIGLCNKLQGLMGAPVASGSAPCNCCAGWPSPLARKRALMNSQTTIQSH